MYKNILIATDGSGQTLPEPKAHGSDTIWEKARP